MKKPTSVMLYPGVVLRNNGMVVTPQIPKTQPRPIRIPMMATLATVRRSMASAKRK